MLGRAGIDTLPEGYVRRVDPRQVDAVRFGQLLDATASMPDPAAERTRLVAALGLWRDTPFGGVPSTWLEQSELPRLLERYLTALGRRIDLDLADGRQEHLVAELGELTARYPLREPMWARLLLVLDRSGRPAEALRQYLNTVGVAAEAGLAVHREPPHLGSAEPRERAGCASATDGRWTSGRETGHRHGEVDTLVRPPGRNPLRRQRTRRGT